MRQDIHPRTPVRRLRTERLRSDLKRKFSLELTTALLGMSSAYVRRCLSLKTGTLTLAEVLELLEHDAFSETFVPRSLIPEYLLAGGESLERPRTREWDGKSHVLVKGDARILIQALPSDEIDCVVTSTPYWGTRLYSEHLETKWGDGETCALGHEQTPEGFVRHSVEILHHLKRVMKASGSVWWNLMDTYNTRTQIRASASETLRAMKGRDPRGWGEYECRRYSAGHSYLSDGEQCLIPSRVAERASRIGYWVKSVIYWKKEGSMPETVDSRVTREAEVVIHLAARRTPYFDKSAYGMLPRELGGRNPGQESEKITDVWVLPTASGMDGHGAQFPIALPGRCIGLSTKANDLVLDPFVGSGSTSVAAALLGRKSIGFDVSASYLATARRRVEIAESGRLPNGRIERTDGNTKQGSFDWE